MYEQVAPENLLKDQLYRITLGKNYHVGRFNRIVDENSHGYAEFTDVFKVIEGVYYPINYPAWIYLSDKFFRELREEEVARTYQDAFERRAVNQIVSSVIGHNVSYY
jgi:hypothetical protein